MQRAFFLAIGVFLILLSLQCASVSKFVFCWEENASVQTAAAQTASDTKPSGKRCEFIPPDWLPWSLFSPGLLVTLYGLSLKSEK